MNMKNVLQSMYYITGNGSKQWKKGVWTGCKYSVYQVFLTVLLTYTKGIISYNPTHYCLKYSQLLLTLNSFFVLKTGIAF